MQATGKIIAVLPPKSGTSAAGKQWTAQTYVMELDGQYPKRIPFEVFGEDRIKEFDMHQGDTMTIQFDIDGREWQGKWYAKITCYKASKVFPAELEKPRQEKQQADQQQTQQEKNDELPF